MSEKIQWFKITRNITYYPKPKTPREQVPAPVGFSLEKQRNNATD